MDIQEWLRTQEYIPKFIRDFHDQKSLFKCIHHLYQDNEFAIDAPNWRDGMIYVVDWFLWFMAGRGYTLQKTRKKGVEFYPIPKYREILEQEKEASKGEHTRNKFNSEGFVDENERLKKELESKNKLLREIFSRGFLGSVEEQLDEVEELAGVKYPAFREKLEFIKEKSK